MNKTLQSFTAALINGESGTRIDLLDRGVQYGDGLFETIACHAGHAAHLDRHLERLERGCAVLGLEWPGRQLLRAEVHQLIRATDAATQSWIVKIMLTGGTGSMGYARVSTASTRIVILLPWPVNSQNQEHGLHCAMLQTRLGSNRQLAGLKHLNRLEQVLAARELQTLGLDEGLLCNQDGFIIEAVSSNVFFAFDDRIVTPLLDASGVHGITRDRIMEAFKARGIEVHQEYVYADSVALADEIILCNSIRGARPVAQLGDRRITARVMYQQITQMLANDNERHKVSK